MFHTTSGSKLVKYGNVLRCPNTQGKYGMCCVAAVKRLPILHFSVVYILYGPLESLRIFGLFENTISFKHGLGCFSSVVRNINLHK